LIAFSAVSVSAQSQLIGDLSGNFEVDGEDLWIVAEQWLNTGGCSEPNCADLYVDGQVDFLDFTILAQNWKKKVYPLVINEFMASNSTNSGITDPQGDYDDWIEIHNYGNIAIDIAGMYITDNISDPTAGYHIPNNVPAETNIPPGGYLLIWADEDIADSPGLHANFQLNKDGEEIGLFYTDGITLIDSIIFADQTTDISFGREPDANDNLVTLLPTPGASNNNSYIGLVDDTKFSIDRGFYKAPFDVAITCSTGGATIRYTLDFSEPTEFHGSVYAGPISIINTTCLRAAAFKPGYKSSDVDTHSYIFLEDVNNQPEYPPGFPTVWHVGFPVNYQVHPDVVAGYNMEEALLSIPTMSIVMDMDDLFGQENGIYSNSCWPGGGEDGPLIENPGSVELIRSDGTEGFSINCGIRMYGAGSRNPEENLKHTFRLLFKGIYGSSKLNYPFFEDSPVEQFDTIVIRGGNNFKWNNHGSSEEKRLKAQYIRDNWAKDTQLAMSHPSSHSNYVHLYLNGLYWGLYNPCERPSGPFLAEHLGGEREDWDALNSGEAVDGDRVAWNAMMDIAEAGLSSHQAYENIQQYLDVENLIDFVIIEHYTQNTDWAESNWYAGRRRLPGAGYKLFLWDTEYAFFDVNLNMVTADHPDSPRYLYNALRQNPEFRLLFADHLHRHMFNNGLMTPGPCRERWMRRANEIYDAIIGESARWGDSNMDEHGDVPYTRDGDWIPALNWILNDFMSFRTDILLDQYRAIGLYPDTVAPTFYIDTVYQHGGYITPPASLTMTAPAGTIYYTFDGNDPYLSPAGLDSATIIPEDAAKAVLIPTASNPSGTAWRTNPGFNDSGWTDYSWVSGKTGGVGYERSSGYEDHISYDVESEMYGSDTSCYIRIPFTVTAQNLIDFDEMTLKIRYDDGFVAYINGTEVTRENFTGTPQWDSSADNADRESSSFALFDITSHIGVLNVGSNILAIHGLNAEPDSSDLLISPELVLETTIGGGPSDSAIVYGSPIILTETTHVKARAVDSGEWSALNEAVYATESVKENLRITEIMYHPEDTNDPNAEFIELVNIGAGIINLNHVRFNDGIDFIFPSLQLGPDEYVVIVHNIEAFEAEYGTGKNIAGQYKGRLDNGGERITLEDANGQTILNFRFKDGWYPITDGSGFSLNIIDPCDPCTDNWEYQEYWQPSSVVKGTPGADDTSHVAAPGDIVINEVLAHSDGNPYNWDWIELHNPTDHTINIGGWFLSDNDANFRKYEIATGDPRAPVPAGGYVVFTETGDFDNPSDPGSHDQFALSEHGETVYLCSGSGGQLAGGFCAHEDFGASEADVTFGRYTKSPATANDVDFVPMATYTYSSENTAGPKVGPIVITEIMYHPNSVNQLNNYAEYVELYNTSGGSVTLDDWLFTDETDDIEFYFPPGTSLGSGQRLLLVKNLSIFEDVFGTPGVTAFEWLSGRLNNAGEKIQLSRPGEPEPDGFIPYYRVDRVNYGDGSHPENFHELGYDPWPTSPDGGGDSLHRITPGNYGNDVGNWTAGTPTPGA
jgi:hypothetical protein